MFRVAGEAIDARDSDGVRLVQGVGEHRARCSVQPNKSAANGSCETVRTIDSTIDAMLELCQPSPVSLHARQAVISHSESRPAARPLRCRTHVCPRIHFSPDTAPALITQRGCFATVTVMKMPQPASHIATSTSVRAEQVHLRAGTTRCDHPLNGCALRRAVVVYKRTLQTDTVA